MNLQDLGALQNLGTKVIRHETKTLNYEEIRRTHTDYVNVMCKWLKEEHEFLGNKIKGNSYFFDDHVNAGTEVLGRKPWEMKLAILL